MSTCTLSVMLKFIFECQEIILLSLHIYIYIYLQKLYLFLSLSLYIYIYTYKNYTSFSLSLSLSIYIYIYIYLQKLFRVSGTHEIIFVTILLYLVLSTFCTCSLAAIYGVFFFHQSIAYLLIFFQLV